MWTTEHSIETEAPSEVIWDILTNVEDWSQWSPDLEASSLSGPFAVGTRGQLRPGHGPPIDFELVDVDPGTSFTDEAPLPGGSIRFEHQLTQTGSRVRITYRVSVTGPLAEQVGPQIARDVPQSVQNLARLAEARSGRAPS